ncbi:MAG: glycosyltransferase [Actinobacteria bacterium]|nr:glycosyltransferase [Actinomycetota bacterium]
MNVIVVSHLYPYPGVNQHLFVHDQCVALGRLGVRLRVISPTPYTPRVLWFDPRLRRRGSKPQRAVRDGITTDYPRFPQPPRLLLFDRLGDMAYRRLRRLPWIAEGGFDLIHAHQALPDGAIAAHLSRDLGVPYVVTLHGVDVHHGLRRGGAVAARTTEVLRGAAAVVVVSDILARKLAAYLSLDNVHVVQNGGPGGLTPAQPAAYLPGRRLVLCAGRLVPGKGFEQVLQALARLQGDHDDVHCVIAGEGALRRRLITLATALSLGERVHFVGRLEQGALLAMMARADVFALPSAPESFGLVHLEAMTQGTPVIACLDQGPADFIEDGVSGYLVPSGDVDALTGVLSTALADRAAATAVGEAGRSVAAAFTWERNARRMLDIYAEVVAGSARKD